MGEVIWNKDMSQVPKHDGDVFAVRTKSRMVYSPCYFQVAGVISEEKEGDLILWMQKEPVYITEVEGALEWAVL